MKTDILFYQIFQEFPQFFFEICSLPSHNANRYSFSSIEVKQLAFRIDGLFLPNTNDPNFPIYLTEIQFQPDPNFYYRVFSELHLYLKQYQPQNPWHLVIIYPNRNTEGEVPIHFQHHLALPTVTRIYLNELPQTSLGAATIQLILEQPNQAPEAAKTLIQQAKTQLTPTQVQQKLIDLIQTIIVYKLPNKSREEIAAMLGLSDLKQTRVYQEALAEGREEGIEQVQRENIFRMSGHGMSPETIAQLLALPLETVTQILGEQNN